MEPQPPQTMPQQGGQEKGGQVYQQPPPQYQQQPPGQMMPQGGQMYQQPPQGQMMPQGGQMYQQPTPGQMMPQGGQMYQQPPPVQSIQQPTVIVTQPQVSGMQPMCPYCSATVTAVPGTKIGVQAWLICFVLLIFGCWPCCLLPFCMSSCQDKIRRCPNCNRER